MLMQTAEREIILSDMLVVRLEPIKKIELIVILPC